jgi:hypothetical protein
MKKQTLETFIKKYSLNGTIEAVKLNVDSKKTTLVTNTITEEKNVLIDVKYNKFDALTDDCVLGIHDTSKLKSMLSVLGDEITLTTNKKDDKVTSVVFNDTSTDVQFVTADLSVIPDAPKLKKLPDFNVEIELNDEFISKFAKAKNALPDVDTFTLMMNKKGVLELVLGYSSLNSNRIKLNVKTLNSKDKLGKVINFNAKYLKEILSANSDCENSVLKVSDAGLAMVTFNSDDFESNYYMVEIKSVD